MAISYEELPGKTVLIGLTYYTADGELIEQKQLWGTAVRSDNKIISIKRPNGEIFDLPPDLSAFSAAAPGEYRLRSTGEVVNDPDYLVTYTVTKNRQ